MHCKLVTSERFKPETGQRKPTNNLWFIWMRRMLWSVICSAMIRLKANEMKCLCSRQHAAGLITIKTSINRHLQVENNVSYQSLVWLANKLINVGIYNAKITRMRFSDSKPKNLGELWNKTNQTRCLAHCNRKSMEINEIAVVKQKLNKDCLNVASYRRQPLLKSLCALE